MPRKTNLIGQRFGRLTVIAEAPSVKSPCGSSRTMWKCVCDCGNEIVAGKSHLLHGETTSCGCYRKEVTSAKQYKHGGKRTRLYRLWTSIKARCSPGGAEPEVYYNKGIRVCEEWSKDYAAFRDWALANGYDESAPRGATTIDRIDNGKGYSPENCRFVSLTENARNKSNTIRKTIDGVTKTVMEWCEIYKADPRLVRERLRRGWNIEKALETPPRKMTRRVNNG